MQSVQEFMQSYFRERTDLRRGWLTHSETFREKYFTADYSRSHHRSEDEIRSFEKDNPAGVLDVDDSGASAVAVTTEPSGKRQQRRRYHLQRSGETWLIQRQEFECFICKGTGKS